MAGTKKLTVSPNDFTKTHISPELRTELNHTLLQNNCIPQIHAALLNQAQSAGFVEALRARTLELLRTGKASSYNECMEMLLGQIKFSPAEAQNGVNGSSKEAKSSKSLDEPLNMPQSVIDEPLIVPQSVIDEGVRALRAHLDPLLGIKHDD